MKIEATYGSSIYGARKGSSDAKRAGAFRAPALYSIQTNILLCRIGDVTSHHPRATFSLPNHFLCHKYQNVKLVILLVICDYALAYCSEYASFYASDICSSALL